jgi:hypothetical protein
MPRLARKQGQVFLGAGDFDVGVFYFAVAVYAHRFSLKNASSEEKFLTT